MKSYKDVCGVDSCVWFEISPKEGKKFLKWAKDLGCIWVNGEIIEPRKGADFFHFSIHSDGTLANVAMFVWVAKHEKFANIDIPKRNLINAIQICFLGINLAQ